MFTDAAAQQMLNAMDETPAAPAAGYAFASLHSAYSTTGTNELNGGAPAYARKGVTGAAASGRSKVFTPSGAFDVPAGSTVAWVGRWSLVTAGTFWGMAPAGAGAKRQFNVSDAADVTANTIDSPAHGLAADNRVVFWAAEGAALPAGLAEGTIYWVIATGLTTDVFSVSTTQGGAAVDITGNGDGTFQTCVPEVFAGQGTYTVTTDTLSVPAT
jgi:hypothetical protein